MSERKAGRIDPQLVKALAHPVRVHILEELQHRVASPSELSKEMEESLGVISYHANTLVSCGCLELVRTRPRRGALEHFFRATPRSFIGHRDWRRAPESMLGGVTEAAVGSFLDRATAALAAGTIDSQEDTTLSWMPLTVDEAGWSELAEALAEAQRLASEIHAQSVGRLNGSEGIPVIVGVAGFRAGREDPAGPG